MRAVEQGRRGSGASVGAVEHDQVIGVARRE